MENSKTPKLEDGRMDLPNLSFTDVDFGNGGKTVLKHHTRLLLICTVILLICLRSKGENMQKPRPEEREDGDVYVPKEKKSPIVFINNLRLPVRAAAA